MKKIQTVLVLVIVLCLSLTMATAEEFGSNPSGKIVEWSQGEKVMKLEKELIAEIFPNVDYEYVLVNNNDFLTKIMTAVASNLDVPDVVSCEVSNRGQLFAMDILDNLEAEPYNYDRSLLVDAVVPGLVNERDELVSLDNQYCPSGLVYRRDLMEKYFGVSEPDDVYELVKDWDSFIATGLKLKEVAGEGVYMMSSISDLMEMLSGQEMIDYIDGDTVDLTKRYSAVFQKACEIRDAGVPLGNNEKNSTSWNAAYTDESVMFFNHASWSTNSCIASNDTEKTTMGKWGFTLAPEKAWLNGGTSQGIYKNSENKEAAWAFIKYFKGTTEGYEPIYTNIGWIPSFKAFYEGDDAPIHGTFKYADWFNGQNICEYLYESTGDNVAPYEKFSEYSTTVTQCFKDTCLQFMINDQMTAEEGMVYLKDNLQQLEPMLNIL